MAYILVKSNGIDTITVQDGVIDNYDTSLNFIGRYSRSYGQDIAQNTLRLLENFASPLSPDNNPTLNSGSPLIGQTWYDTGNERLMIYKNNAWVGLMDADDNVGSYTAGNGIDLTAGAFSVIYGNTNNTSVVGNDSRVIEGATAYTWGDHRAVGYSTQTLTAGTGIDISGGTISTDYTHGTGLEIIGGTVRVKYGTTAGTAAQGNDSRIDNGQLAWTWGDHRIAGYSTQIFTAGSNITISGSGASSIISATNNTYTASTGITLSGSAFSITEVATGSTSKGAVYYNGTTAKAGRFDGGTANPSATTRLNYNGHLHATRFNTPSSILLKDIVYEKKTKESFEDVVAIASGGVKVGHYKADASKTMTRWLIAEEVIKVNPESVSFDQYGNISSIDYSQLIPDLYAAILHLSKEIDLLKSEMVNKDEQ